MHLIHSTRSQPQPIPHSTTTRAFVQTRPILRQQPRLAGGETHLHELLVRPHLAHLFLVLFCGTLLFLEGAAITFRLHELFLFARAPFLLAPFLLAQFLLAQFLLEQFLLAHESRGLPVAIPCAHNAGARVEFVRHCEAMLFSEPHERIGKQHAVAAEATEDSSRVAGRFLPLAIRREMERGGEGERRTEMERLREGMLFARRAPPRARWSPRARWLIAHRNWFFFPSTNAKSPLYLFFFFFFFF